MSAQNSPMGEVMDGIEYVPWPKHLWLWHAVFDGTRICPCRHSRYFRAELRALHKRA